MAPLYSCSQTFVTDFPTPLRESPQNYQLCFIYRQNLNPFVYSKRMRHEAYSWVTWQPGATSGNLNFGTSEPRLGCQGALTRMLKQPSSNQAAKSVMLQYRCDADTPLLSQDLLWKYSADCPESWDGKFYKRNSRSPDFVNRPTLDDFLVDGRWIHPWVHIDQESFKLGESLIDRQGTAGHFQRSGEYEAIRENNLRAFSKLCDENGLNEAFRAVDSILQQGFLVPASIFFRILQRCIKEKNQAIGRDVYCLIVEMGYVSNTILASCLIRMFALFERLPEANRVFSKLSEPDVFSWTAIISAHTKLGQNKEAIKLYEKMQQSDVELDGHAFVAVLKACSTVDGLEHGKQIHADIVEAGIRLDLFVGNTLVDMYAKSGSLQSACLVFDRLPRRDVITWSALIDGFAQHGNGQGALQLFHQMLDEGVQPDTVTFVCILKAFSNLEALEQGKQIHSHIVQCGSESDSWVGNSLIDLYTKCGSLKDAQVIFDKLQKRDVVTWSSLIEGYAHYGYGKEALLLFKEMQKRGLEPNQITFLSIVKACAGVTELDQGRLIHFYIVESGFELDLLVSNTLIDMYTKCGSIEDAQILFDKLPKRDVVTWSALIAGYAHHGYGKEALQIFRKMQGESMKPNHVTFVSILKACSSIGALQQGKCMHSDIIERGYELDPFVGNSLIDMYAKCGSLEDARVVFEILPKGDVVTWNALIAGYAHNSNYTLALQNFEGMQQAGLKPNEVTFMCLLSACSHGGLVDEGCFHFELMRDNLGILPTIEHYNSMIGLLGNAGCLDEAEDLLETLPVRTDIVGWTSLLGSCRTHKNVHVGKRCFDHFVSMEGRNAAGYALMSSIYVNAGMVENAEKVEELRQHANVWKKPAKAFIEIDKEVHDFVVADNSHPWRDEIYAKLKALSVQLREEGYTPRLDLVLDSIPDEDKEDCLCGHSERLAIACGLIRTAPGTTIRVTKNLRVCADCHNVARLISKIEMREIMIIDAYRIHDFNDGVCSCKDYC